MHLDGNDDCVYALWRSTKTLDQHRLVLVVGWDSILRRVLWQSRCFLLLFGFAPVEVVLEDKTDALYGIGLTEGVLVHGMGEGLGA